MRKPRLFGNGVCAERGLAVDTWFSRWDSYRRNETELALRAQPGTDVRVIAGVMDRWNPAPDAPEYRPGAVSSRRRQW